jgi:mannosyl-3-phosphoglycerate phosphatase
MIIVSDLDGTLLHPQTYSFDAAQPALTAIRQQGIPLVLCTSKTRVEVEAWRARLGNQDPFIVENGGAIYLPQGYFPFSLKLAKERGEYEVVEFGKPYLEVVEALRAASQESGCEVLGFHDMTVADISRRTLLPVRGAELAKQREYDEPFEILGQGAHTLLGAIERRGMRWTRGDRFYHINAGNDKAMAARRLIGLYRKAYGSVLTIGVGNGDNDQKLLRTTDVAVVIRSRFADGLREAVPGSQVTAAPGPHGWNEAILRLISLRRPAATARVEAAS